MSQRDKTIKIWDARTGRCKKTLKDAHNGSVLCLQFDEEILVSGSSDFKVFVWDMKTLEPVMRLSGHSMGVLDLCFDQNWIVSCSKVRAFIHPVCSSGFGGGELTVGLAFVCRTPTSKSGIARRENCTEFCRDIGAL